MHNTLGRSPGSTSYSKSQTTIVPKFSLTMSTASRRSDAAGRDDHRDRSCGRRMLSGSTHRAFVLANSAQETRPDFLQNRPYSRRHLRHAGWLPVSNVASLAGTPADWIRSIRYPDSASAHGTGRTRHWAWSPARGESGESGRSADGALPALPRSSAMFLVSAL